MNNSILDGIFDILIKRNNLTVYRESIFDIKDILFKNFNPHLLMENQKFDFSLSARKQATPGLRFSYNNYGEKENFQRKILKLFKAVNGGYDLVTLRKILNLMNKTNEKHQTTVGLEWLAHRRFPRFKLYFEELFNSYTKEERIKQVKNICGLIGLDYFSLGLERKPEIGAFCIDFLPDKKKSLKVYLLIKKLDPTVVGQIPNSPLLNKSRKYLKLFLDFLYETKCFYYITKRFDDKGDLISWKLYKIYEVRQISDFNPSIKEIFDFLNEIGFKKNQIVNFIRLSQDVGFLPYPVIFSLDFSKDGIKVDSYFSLIWKG